MSSSELESLFRRPLSDAARGFLRNMQLSGGRMDISVGLGRRRLAQECRGCGYVHVSKDERTAKLTGLGQAYLDRLMTAN